MTEESSLDHFTRTAEKAANQVIASYSTSFGLATRLLGKRHRQHVSNIYALVRVADEIVDGMAAEAGLTIEQQRDAFETFVDETHRALAVGCSSDLVVHAFARTARGAGIDTALVDPFFASMRTDLTGQVPVHDDATAAAALTHFSAEQHAEYVYGSAEAVGLMCLKVFMRDQIRTPEELITLDQGAKQLGAAFQNINFLRDLSDDTFRLGRSYLSTADRLTAADLTLWVQVIRAQLADADLAIPLLPQDSRAAVRSARALFGALTDRIAAVSVDELYARRIRVPNPIKAALAARAVMKTRLESTR